VPPNSALLTDAFSTLRCACGAAKREGQGSYRYSDYQIDPAPRKEFTMVNVALLVRLEAKPGKESEVANFLRNGLAIVEAEPATTAWFALQLGPSTFGIFDAFPNEAGRQAHLSGRVAAALMARASELFSTPPSIEQVDVLASKLP
jgi:quinol monooxygenase YgiN